MIPHPKPKEKSSGKTNSGKFDSKQNFPGWKQILIKPFDILCDLRFWLAAEHGFEWALKGTGFELMLVSKLLNWASQRSVGVSAVTKLDRARAIEGYSKTLAGH